MPDLTMGPTAVDPDEVRFRQLQDALIAKGMIAPDTAPPTQQVSPALQAPAPAPRAPATPQNKGRREAHGAVLRDLKDEILKHGEERVARAAAAALAAKERAKKELEAWATPEQLAKLEAMKPVDRWRAQRKMKLAAQNAQSIERSKERAERLHAIRKEKYESAMKQHETKLESHDLAKSKREIVEETLLSKGYDKEFARKHSRTLDAICPTCEHHGIRAPMTRNFDGIEYTCSNPDHGESFKPVDPTAKKVTFVSVRKAHEGSKSDVKAGRGLEAGAMRPRLLKPVKES
jgi:hypothetical protein